MKKEYDFTVSFIYLDGSISKKACVDVKAENEAKALEKAKIEYSVSFRREELSTNSFCFYNKKIDFPLNDCKNSKWNYHGWDYSHNNRYYVRNILFFDAIARKKERIKR